MTITKKNNQSRISCLSGCIKLILGFFNYTVDELDVAYSTNMFDVLYEKQGEVVPTISTNINRNCLQWLHTNVECSFNYGKIQNTVSILNVPMGVLPYSSVYKNTMLSYISHFIIFIGGKSDEIIDPFVPSDPSTTICTSMSLQRLNSVKHVQIIPEKILKNCSRNRKIKIDIEEIVYFWKFLEDSCKDLNARNAQKMMVELANSGIQESRRAAALLVSRNHKNSSTPVWANFENWVNAWFLLRVNLYKYSRTQNLADLNQAQNNIKSLSRLDHQILKEVISIGKSS